jgi:glycosyltransferase involved in cell wall biosynthesis
MHFQYPAAARVTTAAFDPESDADAVRREIGRLADQLLPVLAAWVETERLDQLIVENAWAIPMQLPLAVALYQLAEQTGLPTIGHHHDYWWERERFATCVVPDVLEQAFPPALPNVRHASINSLAARSPGAARSALGRDSQRVRPATTQPRPDVRRQLRSELGMDDRGALVVQPTRVVPRKGIEMAIELMGKLRDRDAVLLITSPAGDEGLDYLIALERQAERAHVRLRYAADRFMPDLEGRPLGPVHSLHDAYLDADLNSYPSLYEGFGNALLEAVFYGKPVLVNRYPVYDADIKPLGFRFVEMDGAVTKDTVRAVQSLLADPAGRAADASHNFAIGRKHLGYDRLERSLGDLLRAG